MVLVVLVVNKMELGTFGSILKYAIELETEVIEFYTSMTSHASDQKLVDLFKELVLRGEKRIKTLERVRRENTTEMILEPIKDFNSDEYSIDTTTIPSDNEATRNMAIDIETKLEEFYNTAAKKIEFLIEAAYAFELLAEKNTETKKRLMS